jgi:hypothetical protein
LANVGEEVRGLSHVLQVLQGIHWAFVAVRKSKFHKIENRQSETLKVSNKARVSSAWRSAENRE